MDLRERLAAVIFPVLSAGLLKLSRSGCTFLHTKGRGRRKPLPRIRLVVTTYQAKIVCIIENVKKYRDVPVSVIRVAVYNILSSGI